MLVKVNLKFSLLFILIIQSFFVNAQNYDSKFLSELKDRAMNNNEVDQDRWFAYEGQLGEGRNVYFLLNVKIFNPKRIGYVWGEYFYRKYHRAIKLEGEIKGSKIYLKELVDGKKTGTIIFDAENNNALWRSNKGKEYVLDLNTIDLREYAQEYYVDQSSRITNTSFKSFVADYEKDITPTLIN